MEATNRWVLSDSQYGRSPQICVDRREQCRAAWISCGPEGEAILTSQFNSDRNPTWSPPQICVPPRRTITGLTLSPFEDGILLAWTEAGRNGGLRIRTITDQGIGESRCVVTGDTVPAHPTLCSDQNGFALFWTVRDGPFRRVEGLTASKFENPLIVRQISENGRKAAYPKAVLKNGTAAIVWQEMTAVSSSILFGTINFIHPAPNLQVLVEDRECAAAMPNITAAENGFWVVWQSDRSLSSGPELVRDLELIHLSENGTWAMPSAPIPRIDRRGRAEDQGFEFPIPICAPDGRLILVGRGSQSIRRLDLGASGWSDFTQLDEPGWQCRGRPGAALVFDNHVWWTAREKGAVVVRRHPLHLGVVGTPNLTAAPKFPFNHKKTFSETPRNLIFGGFRVLFGDIHQHTAASDGTGTAEETYFRAKVRYGDRVVCVTDHESFLGKQTVEGEWREHCRVADEYDEPGAFVTLKGFEWTGKMHPGPGHKVVYLPAGGGPLLSRDDPKTDSSPGLLRECLALGAQVVPHHVGWTGADMENHVAEVQTCWEIVSCHGAYERSNAQDFGTRGDDKAGQFIADALDKNLRFGLVGGSDGHGLSRHHGVSRKQDSHRTGLTGFLSHDLTRDGVLEALRKRRCFATSGAKIALWFEVDGRPMGEELVAGYEVPFRVSAVPLEQIKHVCLVTNGGLEIPLSTDGNSVDAHGTLPPPPDNGFSYYFVRLTQEDGEIAWSSPIWLDPPGPA